MIRQNINFGSNTHFSLLHSIWEWLPPSKIDGEWGMGNGEWGMGNGEVPRGMRKKFAIPQTHSPFPKPTSQTHSPSPKPFPKLILHSPKGILIPQVHCSFPKLIPHSPSAFPIPQVHSPFLKLTPHTRNSLAGPLGNRLGEWD